LLLNNTPILNTSLPDTYIAIWALRDVDELVKFVAQAESFASCVHVHQNGPRPGP
jgi:hypothetical protein